MTRAVLLAAVALARVALPRMRIQSRGAAMTSTGTIYDGLRALSCNCTLKPSPELSHTSRNTTFMTWNLLHLARILKFENPEYR